MAKTTSRIKTQLSLNAKTSSQIAKTGSLKRRNLFLKRRNLSLKRRNYFLKRRNGSQLAKTTSQMITQFFRNAKTFYMNVSSLSQNKTQLSKKTMLLSQITETLTTFNAFIISKRVINIYWWTSSNNLNIKCYICLRKSARSRIHTFQILIQLNSNYQNQHNELFFIFYS